MRFLPDDFPSNNLTATELRKLEYYYEQYVVRNSDRYGFGHFALACYAALPAVLTPDLLHKLWLNFKTYYPNDQLTIIHPVAPVDLLLSPLVEEIGFEIYEMPEAIRHSLLLYLNQITDVKENNTLKLFGLDDIAAFLKDYTQYDFTPENADDNAFREAQEWTAMSYLDPGKAFSQVAQAFQGAATNPSRLRYKDAIEKMSSRFALEIVKDSNAIPNGFKAMTALTSVVRDVLMKREPKKLEELKKELHFSNELLTEAPVLQDNIINIEIPEDVEKIIQSPGNKDENGRKVKAFVIGIDEKDENNANLFANAIKELIPAEQLDITIFLYLQRKISRFNVLEELAKMIENTHEKDDLLVYIAASAVLQSGHCIMAGTDYLRDEDIGNLLNNVICASVTLVLEVDHAATPYWLNTNEINRVVFASGKSDQEPVDNFSVIIDGIRYSAFTRSFVEALKKSKLQISNRNLFVEVLKLYASKIDTREFDIEVWRTKAPQLLASPPTFNRFFLQGNNKRVQLQDLLRQTGFYDFPSSGEWDKETAIAFTNYKRSSTVTAQNSDSETNHHGNHLAHLDSNKTKNELISEVIELLQGPLHNVIAALLNGDNKSPIKHKPPENKINKKTASLSEHIAALEATKNSGHATQTPIFMLVYSDPLGQLTEMQEEKKMIRQHLDAKYPAYNIEILEIENPEPNNIITNAFKARENRNRIKFFYYSGFDTEGNFKLKQDVFHFTDFAALLDYQENLQLVISNTCKSQYFAEYLTQMGVQIAIGSEDYVYDNYALQFAIELFDAIANGNDIEEISKLYTPPNEEQYGSQYAV